MHITRDHVISVVVPKDAKFTSERGISSTALEMSADPYVHYYRATLTNYNFILYDFELEYYVICKAERDQSTIFTTLLVFKTF